VGTTLSRAGAVSFPPTGRGACIPRPCPQTCGGTGRCRWSPMAWPSSFRLLGRLGRHRRSSGACGYMASCRARSSCGTVSVPRLLSRLLGWEPRPQSRPAAPSAHHHSSTFFASSLTGDVSSASCCWIHSGSREKYIHWNHSSRSSGLSLSISASSSVPWAPHGGKAKSSASRSQEVFLCIRVS